MAESTRYSPKKCWWGKALYLYEKRQYSDRKNSLSHPDCGDLIFKLKGAKYFTKLDLNSDFHQLELHEDSRYITAFQTRSYQVIQTVNIWP